MFDVAPTELMLIAVVALIVIGPKDLPKAMRFVGYWVGRSRNVMRQFRSGFDTMVREAELQEMEKKWAAENERIMREHQPGAVPPEATGAVVDHQDGDAPAVMTERPAVAPDPATVDMATVVAAPSSEDAPPEQPHARGVAES